MPGFCSGCGKPAGEGSHRRCEERARATDTPRFCVDCGRKLKVQILPRGWRAECVSCGPLGSSTPFKHG